MILEQLEGFCRRCRSDDMATPVAQQQSDGLALVPFVFDDDDEGPEQSGRAVIGASCGWRVPCQSIRPRFSERDLDAKATSLADAGHHLDRMAEQGGGTLCDRQAKADAAVMVVGFRCAQLDEFLEDGFQALLLDSGSGVPDLDGKETAMTSAADQHRAARRVADGIGDKVEQDALEEIRVRAPDSRGVVYAQLDLPVTRQGSKSTRDVLQQACDGEIGEMHTNHSQFEPGDVQQGVHNAFSALRRRLNLAQNVTHLWVLRLLAQECDPQADRLQWLTQIMAGGCE